MSDTRAGTRILVVDDSANDVELALDAFAEGRLGSAIDVARSGKEALDHLFGRKPGADRSPQPLPDLILLDLKMPGIDGFEVLCEIKRSPSFRRIPVVVLTSSRDEGDRARAYDAGANSYLVKPVSYSGMVHLVREIEDYWLTVNVGAPVPVDPRDGDPVRGS